MTPSGGRLLYAIGFSGKSSSSLNSRYSYLKLNWKYKLFSRRVQELAQQSQTMERETWDSLLSFLLAINDALLAPPAVKDDVGDQLCERVLGVLYEIWLIACVKSFPGPTLWKTFQVVLLDLLGYYSDVVWC